MLPWLLAHSSSGFPKQRWNCLSFAWNLWWLDLWTMFPLLYKSVLNPFSFSSVPSLQFLIVALCGTVQKFANNLKAFLCTSLGFPPFGICSSYASLSGNPNLLCSAVTPPYLPNRYTRRKIGRMCSSPRKLPVFTIRIAAVSVYPGYSLVPTQSAVFHFLLWCAFVLACDFALLSYSFKGFSL